MPKLVQITGCSLLVMLLAGTALGAEGRIPVWQPGPLNPGTTGSYIVTRNLASVGGPVISVAGSGVENIDIDLNGMTLTGGFGMDVINVTNVKTLVLRNGTLESEDTGAGGNGVTVITAGEIVIEDLTIHRGLMTGIAVFQTFPEIAFAIRRNLIYEPEGDGIMIQGSGET
jgi:hypothetical protein